MTTKQKITAGASAALLTAGAIAGTMLYDTTVIPTETTTQYEETIIEDVEETTNEEISEIETEEEETVNRSSSWSWGRTEEVTDPLEDYKTTIEKNGSTISIYENVPFELQGEIFNSVSNYSGTTYDLTDISIMENYIFVNTADGLRYISDISDGAAIDENITATDFTGYNIFLNAYLDELTDLKPIKNFNGFFYGNDYILFLDNYLFESFSGELQRISISSSAPIIKNSNGGRVRDCEFYITGNANEMGVAGNAIATKMQNVMVEANISGTNVGGIFGRAAGDCLIENCIVNGTLSGINVGSFIGVLDNQIEFKNNVATTTVNCDIGYGGKAVGYVEYDYKDDIDKINGAYCETELTVEGLVSELFIGNIVEPNPVVEKIPIIEKVPIIETEEIIVDNNHTAPLEAAFTRTVTDENGVDRVETIYNLALIDWEALERGYYIFYEDVIIGYEDVIVGYDTKVVFDEKAPKMTGYYDFKDMKALNQYATAKELKNFYEENGLVYFESEQEGEGTHFSNLIYSNGDCVAFVNGDFDGGTLIIVSYEGARMNSFTTHEIIGPGTYFVSLPENEEITDEDGNVIEQEPAQITEVKAFLWSSVDSMNPLCEAKTISQITTTGAEEIYE